MECNLPEEVADQKPTLEQKTGTFRPPIRSVAATIIFISGENRSNGPEGTSLVHFEAPRGGRWCVKPGRPVAGRGPRVDNCKLFNTFEVYSFFYSSPHPLHSLHFFHFLSRTLVMGAWSWCLATSALEKCDDVETPRNIHTSYNVAILRQLHCSSYARDQSLLLIDLANWLHRRDCSARGLSILRCIFPALPEDKVIITISISGGGRFTRPIGRSGGPDSN
jgi:hypothetical protein